MFFNLFSIKIHYFKTGRYISIKTIIFNLFVPCRSESSNISLVVLDLKRPKSSCLKWPYGRPGIDYRVASLFTRYLPAIGIIPENSIGQFLHAEINERDLTVSYGRTQNVEKLRFKNR